MNNISLLIIHTAPLSYLCVHRTLTQHLPSISNMRSYKVDTKSTVCENQIMWMYLLNDGSCLILSKLRWLSCITLSCASFFLQHSTLRGWEWKCSSRASCTNTEQLLCYTYGYLNYTFTQRDVEQAAVKDLEAPLYLHAFDEVSHWEVVVEKDADQHLHHFTAELKREVICQDQLETKRKIQLASWDYIKKWSVY